jgi:TonB dependent receptor
MGTTGFTGSKDYHSESVLTYETGYRWQHSPHFSIDLALFYNDYADNYTLSSRPSAEGLDMVFINNGHGAFKPPPINGPPYGFS